jgi:hypothetical protein
MSKRPFSEAELLRIMDVFDSALEFVSGGEPVLEADMRECSRQMHERLDFPPMPVVMRRKKR